MIYNTYDNDEEGDLKRQKLSNPISMISRQYSSFQNNPRIVRVSQQAFGGKDRHSKVWTIKGVRDRRIRLSIPTAIKLYHLQHQLGLTQPSKVIDWLLDVTKHDIDKLPPLQIAPQDYNRFHHHLPHNFNSFAPFSNTTDHDHQGKEAVVSFSPIFNSTTPNYDHHQRTQGKQIMIENKWNSYNYDDHNLSSSAPPFEPQILSCFSSHTPNSFFPPYHHHVMPALELMSSSSPQNSLVPSQPLNLIDTDQVKVIPFGLSMNSRVSSGSNGMG